MMHTTISDHNITTLFDRELPCPVLIARGSHPAAGYIWRRMGSALPKDARVIATYDSGHVLSLETPSSELRNVIAWAVDEFVAEIGDTRLKVLTFHRSCDTANCDSDGMLTIDPQAIAGMLGLDPVVVRFILQRPPVPHGAADTDAAWLLAAEVMTGPSLAADLLERALKLRPGQQSFVATLCTTVAERGSLAHEFGQELNRARLTGTE